MNEIIQNSLVIITVGLSVFFLAKKFILPKKVRSSKSCAEDDCGCH
jgi:hypothetical protein